MDVAIVLKELNSTSVTAHFQGIVMDERPMLVMDWHEAGPTPLGPAQHVLWCLLHTSTLLHAPAGQSSHPARLQRTSPHTHSCWLCIVTFGMSYWGDEPGACRRTCAA